MNILVNTKSHCRRETHVFQRGFSLVEIMVVVAIIGILASIALPRYTDYVRKARAAEATSTLANLKVRMEQYYQDNRTYIGGACAPTSGAKYFSYSCSSTTATAFVLVADGLGDMANFQYTVNQDNAKTSKYDGVSGGSCWLTGKGTSC